MEEEADVEGYVDKYDEDLYQRLGLSRQATTEDIHAAFRRESRKWHPDKSHARHRDVAERKFKQLTEAHEILSHERKRAIYDKFGYTAAAGVSDRELAHYTSIDDVRARYTFYLLLLIFDPYVCTHHFSPTNRQQQFLKKFQPSKEGTAEEEQDYGLKIKGKVTIHDTFSNLSHISEQLTLKPRMLGVSVEETFEVSNCILLMPRGQDESNLISFDRNRSINTAN